jgi:hypothetical protein
MMSWRGNEFFGALRQVTAHRSSLLPETLQHAASSAIPDGIG